MKTQEHGVVLLATDKESKLWITLSGTMSLSIKEGGIPFKVNEKLGNNQHLYITSDEEIEKGVSVYYIDKYLNKVYNSNKAGYGEKQQVIIATTNTSLKSITQIPQEYIQYYIEQYNKGNVITKCEVEYNKCTCETAFAKDDCDYSYLDDDIQYQCKYEGVKLIPDNTINIVIPEEETKMYSREEVEDLLINLYDTYEEKYWIGEKFVETEFKQWIKENLK